MRITNEIVNSDIGSDEENDVSNTCSRKASPKTDDEPNGISFTKANMSSRRPKGNHAQNMIIVCILHMMQTRRLRSKGYSDGNPS